MTGITLRDYQKESVDSVFQYWKKEKGNPLIVAPCGAGKSLIIAAIIAHVLSYPGTRVLVLAHRKEILEQNEAELNRFYPDISTGVFSTGVGRREYSGDVIFAGIQSIEKRITHFDPFDICLIDEAHLLPRSAQTQYGKAIASLKLMRPTCRFIGLTASPYRLDSGYLHKGEGALFDKISHEIEVQKLVNDGYLCPVVSKSGEQTADLVGVKKRAGEFVKKDVAAAFDKDNLLHNACDQIMREGENRRAWLLFCASVEQAEDATQYMRDHGISAECVTGGDSNSHREGAVERFKRGETRCLINVDILTIGFNAPICDLCALLRATDSAALYVQIVGRVMRTYPGKRDALLLDFGGNVERHGPIDDVRVTQPGAGGGDAPAKTCPECLMIVAAGCSHCPECSHEFPPPEPRVETVAYRGAVMRSQIEPECRPVIMATFHTHSKPGKPDSVRAHYVTGSGVVKEWLCPAHGGFATDVAAREVKKRYGVICPPSAAELIALMESAPPPSHVTVKKDGKYDRVISVEVPHDRGSKSSEAPSDARANA